MWNKIELNQFQGLFLLRNGIYQRPIDISSDNKENVIGYCIGKNRIISINSSGIGIKWSSHIGERKDYNSIGYNIHGKDNTNHIMSYIKSNNISIYDYPAIHYCTSFSPGYKDGEWYLPSIGELKLFYDIRMEFREDCITAGISTNMKDDYEGHGFLSFWSSTEYSYNRAHSFYFSSSIEKYLDYKVRLYLVLPFLII